LRKTKVAVRFLPIACAVPLIFGEKLGGPASRRNISPRSRSPADADALGPGRERASEAFAKKAPLDLPTDFQKMYIAPLNGTRELS
jgi:hypothetical protein